jgi:O-antigen ligase
VSRVLPGIVAGIVYLGAALAYVVAVDADLEGGAVAEWAFAKGHSEWLALLAGASLAFGWATGSWLAALLALALVFVGMPFDYPESRFGEPLPTAFYAQILTPVSAALILLGVGARKVRDRRHGRAVGPPA